MDPYGPKWTHMDQHLPIQNRSNMATHVYGPKWTHMGQNDHIENIGPYRPNLTNMDQKGPYGPIWTKAKGTI
jgi:hypothetical protein